MPTVTPADRETAERIVRDAGNGLAIVTAIAAALAEQRERMAAAHIADLIRTLTDIRDFGNDPDTQVECNRRIAELKAGPIATADRNKP